MRVLTIFLILSCLLISDSYGQQWKRDRDHILLGLGASGFMGDLGGADATGSHGLRDFDFNAVKPSIMIGYRYFLLENVAARGNIIYGQVSGDDTNTNEPYRNNRNIHFRSVIGEFSVQGEFYFFNAQRAGARYRRLTRGSGWLGYNISVYAFGGVGCFYFNPEAKFEKDKYMQLEHGTVDYADLPSDGWYELRPLRTEGQGFLPTRDTYSQFQLTVPIGFGVIFQVNRELSIGVEYGFRKTWTDYIDDVSTTYVDPGIYREMFPNDPKKIALAEYFSNPTNNSLGRNVTAPGQQRGGPSSNDAYMFTFITVYYKFPDIGSPRHGLPRF